MFIINLLPIFPLDGYVIIKAVFQTIFSYKKSMNIANVISIIGFVLFFIYNIYDFQPMVLFFLLFYLVFV